MNFVTLTSPPPKPAAELIAGELLAGLNAELARRIENHTTGFALFWESDATPDAIAEALGDHGKLLIDASRENLRNLGTLAAMVEQTLDDFIPPEKYASRRAISFDGSRIILAPPAPGHDAWGRPISVLQP